MKSSPRMVAQARTRAIAAGVSTSVESSTPPYSGERRTRTIAAPPHHIGLHSLARPAKKYTEVY